MSQLFANEDEVETVIVDNFDTVRVFWKDGRITQFKPELILDDRQSEEVY